MQLLMVCFMYFHNGKGERMGKVPVCPL